jgi:hypothetical protein
MGHYSLDHLGLFYKFFTGFCLLNLQICLKLLQMHHSNSYWGSHFYVFKKCMPNYQQKLTMPKRFELGQYEMINHHEPASIVVYVSSLQLGCPLQATQ